MAVNHPKPERPWREIARELSTEYDSDKILELCQELNRALDNDSRESEQMLKKGLRKRAT